MELLIIAAFLLVLSGAAGLWSANRAAAWRNAMTLAEGRASQAEGRVTLLEGEVRLLETALDARDAALNATTKDLADLLFYLQTEGSKPSDVKASLEALRGLEALARRGYGPMFTQSAISASGRLEFFGASPGEFAAAVGRCAHGIPRV